MYSTQDIKQLADLGIATSAIDAQIDDLKKGYPFLKIFGAATLDRGIMKIGDGEITAYVDEWKRYCGNNDAHRPAGRIVKFVPASGAASRMFKDLYEYKNAPDSQLPAKEVKCFFDNIESFPFFDTLDGQCQARKHKSVRQLIAGADYRAVLEILLDKEAMAYGHLPKGLLDFHRYADEVRTPCAEHLVEGAMYAADTDKTVNLHFTVSPEHVELFKAHIDKLLGEYQKKLGVKFDVSFSVQKASTDTVAMDADGNIVRNADGSILFRPGGHGALIENLNDIDADIVFVKNIDNVVPDRLKQPTVEYKQLIAGVLVHTQKRIFEYLHRLDAGNVTSAEIDDMLLFANNTLCIAPGENELYAQGRYAEYLHTLFNRPLRVCGMVKNEGEPGGGPYLTANADGTVSPQILESSQIDKSNSRAVECMQKAAFFNPVDLVCAVKDYRGNKFDLTAFVDRSTGFISEKSKQGVSMKVLELPGLWNGAMSNWNTIFVEVPLATFNPVKTVNDLLREQHR